MGVESRAQTHLQLYAQLEANGYPPDALLSVGTGYELATHLFAGQYRGDGRPFLAHLVGTAAILGALKGPAPLVTAGLLHAVYEFGDFGDGSRGIRADKRRRLLTVVTADVESLIADYSLLAWNARAVANLSERAASLTRREEELILLRLANWLDEAIDRAFLYSAKGARALAALDHTEADLRRLAVCVGHRELAEFIGDVAADLRRAVVPPALRRDGANSFVLAPASYVQRPVIRVGAALRRLRRRWRRAQTPAC